MTPDHEVAGAVAAICLQDLWHLNVWILRICNRLRQPVRGGRLADKLLGSMHLSLLDDARPWGCRRGCCHLFARPLTFDCMDLEDLQQIAATVQVKTSWLGAWWYASFVAWWRQIMRLQARLLPSVCKTFDIWMYGSWGCATDCGNRAGED